MSNTPILPNHDGAVPAVDNSLQSLDLPCDASKIAPSLHESPSDAPIQSDECKTPPEQDESTDEDGSEEDRPSDIDPRQFVRAFMAKLELEHLFDGSLVRRGAPLTAHTRDMIDSVLAVQPLGAPDLLDMMAIFCKANGLGLKRTELNSAMRQVLREEKHRRRNSVMRPLLITLPAEEGQAALKEWGRLGALFEMSALLCIAIFQHFIWQVKQKVLGRTVIFHLMPIIMSAIQGSGKTTFVKMFLGPLCELATGASLLSDFSDRRTLGLFRYPAVLVDDMETIAARDVPILKSIITGDDLVRRQLGASSEVKVRQASTPIGTSNSPIESLVPDDTGHRRFVMLPFHNGQIAKGGDEKIWQVVSELNYDLLWRSVDAFDASPLVEHIVELTQFQVATQKPVGLLKWLLELDLDSPSIRSISLKQGVRAQPLHDLYTAQTGQTLTKQAFASEMFRYMDRPDSSFVDKMKVGHAATLVYRFKSLPVVPQVASTSLRSDLAASEASAASDASAASAVYSGP